MLFAPVLYCVCFFLLVFHGKSEREIGEQLYLLYFWCFEVIGTQAPGQTQSIPIFHSDKNSSFGLCYGVLEIPWMLNCIQHLTLQNQHAILDLIIDLDNKPEELCLIYLPMLNINVKIYMLGTYWKSPIVIHWQRKVDPGAEMTQGRWFYCRCSQRLQWSGYEVAPNRDNWVAIEAFWWTLY